MAVNNSTILARAWLEGTNDYQQRIPNPVISTLEQTQRALWAPNASYLRNQFTGGKSMKIFAVGILAFLSGHFLYIAALIGRSPAIILPALIATAVLSALAIPPLMKRITAPSAGLKIFGYVYLVVVIAMFSCAAALLVTLGAGALTLVFTLGALLFVVSDFIMIYYSFGKKIKPLRAINLLCYYIGQLMIAVCILLA